MSRLVATVRLPAGQAGEQQADLPAAPAAQAGAAKLDAAIAACLPVRQANLKELKYGG